MQVSIIHCTFNLFLGSISKLISTFPPHFSAYELERSLRVFNAVY